MAYESRATMKGNPGDTARRRGLVRVIIPLLSLTATFGLAVGIIFGSAGLLPLWFGILLALGTGIGLVILARRQQSLVYGYFKGARGEEITASELARLSGDWTVFNGLQLPDGGDIDHVAVGPQGVFVIETKHWSGEVALGTDGSILANGRPLHGRSPIAQVRTAVRVTAESLTLDPSLVHGVLCFAGPQFADGPESADEITVCSHRSLTEVLTSNPPTLDAATVARALAALGTLSLAESF